MYSSVVHAWAQRGDPSIAETWFQRCKAAGLEPQVHMYSSLVAASARVGDPNGAAQWLKAAKDAARDQ